MTSTAALHTTTPTRAKVRPEIQALRAAAVLGVVIFHLWPGRLTGGYAGVDVFFVISGFLITGHLMKEAAHQGVVRLGRFWARRIRRLLPAALLVLAFCVVATQIWLPSSLRRQGFTEIIASATYWENWRLAAEAVDYLGAENDASAVQHYWSLSVEEQFYLVWPVLLVATLALLRRRRTSLRLTFAAVLGTIGIASLAFSFFLTTTDPAAAYFVTPTRVWEFAAGGLLALWHPTDSARSGWARSWLAIAGWAAIAVTFFVYTSSTPFPGVAALLPVAGTVAVIAAGSHHRATWLTRCASWAPVRYTGDVSYSLYLWHWPLIVFAPYILNRGPSFVGNVVLLASGFGLAALSKRWIEDPTRAAPWLQRRPWTSYAWAGAAMAVVCGAAWWGIVQADQAIERTESETQRLIDSAVPCFGADAFMSPDQPCVNGDLNGVLLPEPAARKDDTGGAYTCYDADMENSATVESCSYGATGADAVRVALVGNSHAASLLPGLIDHVDEANWSLDTYLGRGCEWAAVTDADDPCSLHQSALQSTLEDGDYDLILVSMRRQVDPDLDAAARTAADRAAAWAPLLEAGTPVAAVADNPMLPDATLDCVTDAASEQDLEACAVSEDVAFKNPDPLIGAVDIAGEGASLIDLTDAYCRDSECPVEIGHVIVYRDTHHITATFSKTLAPYLMDRAEGILAASGAR